MKKNKSKIGFGKTLETMVWVMRLIYGFGPKMMMAIFVLQVLATAIPYAEQRLFSALIDKLVKSVSSGNDLWTNLFIAFFGLRFVKTILIHTWWMLQTIFEIRVEDRLTDFYTTRVTKLDYQQFEDEKIASLKAKVDEEYRWRVRQIVSDIFELITQSISFVMVLVLLIPRYWFMVVILLIGELPGLWVDKKWQRLNWHVFNYYREKNRPNWDTSWQLVNKKFIAELKIMEAVDWLKKRLIDSEREYANARIKNRREKYLPDLFSANFSIVVGGLCMLLIITDINKGLLSIGMFTFYFNIIRSTGDFFAGALNKYIGINEQVLYISNFKKIVELPKNMKNGLVKNGLDKPVEIKFVNVSFRYPNSKIYIYKNLNLTIKPGEKMAIVGKNGAGKSTLIKLLCRFYDTTSGQILVDGVDLKEYDTDYWYRQISLLNQEFNTYDNLTLAENVCIGKERDDKKIIDCLKKADAYELLDQYSRGLDTMMSQRYGGVEPSWGQWQKIAIARMFYHSSPLMILDEPTSSIDAISESKIFSKIYKQVKNKTLIIVSHRFSTVRNAKRILVIDKGKIIEQGSHEELMALGGMYSKSFTIQAKGYN